MNLLCQDAFGNKRWPKTHLALHGQFVLQLSDGPTAETGPHDAVV